MIKEMNDPTLKLGDTVRLRLPPKFDLHADKVRIIQGSCTVIDIDGRKLIENCST